VLSSNGAAARRTAAYAGSVILTAELTRLNTDLLNNCNCYTVHFIHCILYFMISYTFKDIHILLILHVKHNGFALEDFIILLVIKAANECSS